MDKKLKPYGGTSRERLTQLINAANGSNLVEGIDFEYGPIEDSDLTNLNTKVTLRSLKFGKNDTDVRYARLGIDVLSHLPAEMIENVWFDQLPFGIHDILNNINEALGVNLLPEEVINLNYDVPQEAYALRIAPNSSYAWLESEYMFKAFETVELYKILPIVNLNGLQAPPVRFIP